MTGTLAEPEGFCFFYGAQNESLFAKHYSVFFFFLDLALCGLLLGLGIFCAVVTREDIEVFTPFKMWLLSYKKLMAAVFVVQQPRFIMGFNGRKDYENGGIV